MNYRSDLKEFKEWQLVKMIAYNLVWALFLTVCLFVLSTKIFNFRIDEVLSPSMEPKFGMTDIVIVKPMDNYKEGDVLEFKSGNTYVSHELMEIKEDGTYICQGLNGRENAGTQLVQKKRRHG